MELNHARLSRSQELDGEDSIDPSRIIMYATEHDANKIALPGVCCLGTCRPRQSPRLGGHVSISSETYHTEGSKIEAAIKIVGIRSWKTRLVIDVGNRRRMRRDIDGSDIYIRDPWPSIA